MAEQRATGPGFHARVAAVVRTVPAGRVTTYGDVATALGSVRVARHVGYALAACRDPDVPWHRVVNAAGRCSDPGESGRADEQRARLIAEGVAIGENGRIDLARSRFVPQPPPTTSS